MIDLGSVSSTDLKSRRKQLKRRRQVRLLQTFWRSLLLGGMAGALLWLLHQPDWVIYQPEQVDIRGNEFLSVTAIRSLLPLNYPQPLLYIAPQQLSQQIQAKAPIARAIVTRQLLPPRLIVEVKERLPVAIALPPPINRRNPSPREVGFVDAEGVWMPKSSYISLEEGKKLPSLIVIGLTKSFKPYWPRLYQVVSASAVEVFEIDLQDPANVTLRTSIGNVHLGSYSSARIQKQLQVLALMQALPAHVKSSQVDYINLSNPEQPSLQLK